MRKALAFCLAIVLLCGVFPGVSLARETTFTLMVYLCGTDLETDDGSASDDILEMIDAGVDLEGPLTVLVETGGTREWWLENVEADKSERWILAEDGLYCLESDPRRDMGKPDTLADFVAYGVSEFPADRYGLILWNHGGGSTTGVCFDEYTDSYLTCEDIHTALSSAQKSAGDFRLDFIAFDACLMATFEMANYVRDFADYMIASEELAPGYGFDYEALVRALAKDTAISMEAFGKVVADSFLETNLRYDPDDYMTLSVLNLGNMPALTKALETMAGGLSLALEEGQLNRISRNRQNMRSFGDYSRSGSDMVDLRHFVETFAEVYGKDVSAVQQAIDDVVVYNRYTEDNLSDICGISILVPLKTRDEFSYYAEYYDPLNLYPEYSAFLTNYMGMMDGGSYVFASTTPQTTGAWNMINSLGYNVTVTGSMDSFSQVVEQVDEAGATDADAFGEDGIFTYSLTLSPEEMEHLSYVEGNLMIDISDDEMEAYVDLGYLQNTVIDWDNNTVYSLFDGSWPMLEDQLVHMTDQIITGGTRRSLINAWVNDEDVYLLVIFDDKRPNGEIIGYTQGYTESGAPMRGHEKLTPGDVIIPQYYLYYYLDGEEYIEPFDGDPIHYTGQTLSFEYVDLTGIEMDFTYTFCLNDIFGDYQFTDFLFFSL